MAGPALPQRILANGWLTGEYTAYSSYNYTGVFKDANTVTQVARAALPKHMPKLRGLPEVIVTGRANAGKSSLLNTILGRKGFLPISKKPGRTRAFRFYRVGAEPGKLVVVDSPGYGALARPEWGKLLDEYLRTRRALKRVYILLNGKHPLKPDDSDMLKYLSELIVSRRGRFTLQPVITKVDDIRPADVERYIDRICNSIKEITPVCMSPIVTSATMDFGIDKLRRNMEVACGLATLEKEEKAE